MKSITVNDTNFRKWALQKAIENILDNFRASPNWILKTKKETPCRQINESNEDIHRNAIDFIADIKEITRNINCENVVNTDQTLFQ